MKDSDLYGKPMFTTPSCSWDGDGYHFMKVLLLEIGQIIQICTENLFTTSASLMGMGWRISVQKEFLLEIE